MSFTDMWQTRFPGAYYHTMDASNIPQGVWERNDFPFEKFFQKDVDESVLDWNPNGANPAMDSSAVQSRLHSISGQKSQATKKKRREKYVELNEESGLKRKMLEQETDKRYFKSSVARQTAFKAYEKNIMEL